MLNIFVNTWGNYNVNGADGGEWITLPMEEDELEERLAEIAKNIGDDDPEWAIHDYEWTVELELGEVHETDSIKKLNERCYEADGLDEFDVKEIAAAIEAFGYSFAEALERQQRGCFTFYPDDDLEEVARQIAEECYFTRDIPEFFKNYFDYEAFARDLGYDGWHETEYGVICE